MRISLRVLLVLVSGSLGGCVHTWAGKSPQVCTPSSVPLTLPSEIVQDGRLVPGTLYIQVITDESEATSSFAFLIYVPNMRSMPKEMELKEPAAYITHVVGPIATDEQWRHFSNSLKPFASTRPGGFVCDGPDGGCPDNKVSSLLDGENQRLVWGPKPPSPPPPESFGVMQNHQLVGSSTVGGWSSVDPASQKALYASLSNLPPDPGPCRPINPTDERKKELGEYVYRALLVREASNGPHPYYKPPSVTDGGVAPQ